MAAVARDESKSEENNMIQIKLHKSDLVSIAKALTAGQRLNKWERRKLVDKLHQGSNYMTKPVRKRFVSVKVKGR